MEPHVAGAERHHAVRQLEPLQHRLRAPDHGLQLVVGLAGRDDLHHLDLVELVLADHPLGVLAVGARLAAIAGRERAVSSRQLGLGQDLGPVQRGERDLRGRNQVERAARVGLHRPEHLLLELGQHRHPDHGLRVHQVRHPDLGEAVLASVEIQHELHERPVEPGRRAPHHGEARLGDLARPVEVEDAEGLADLEVLLRLEGELSRRAPAAHLDVVIGRATHRHARVGQVRHLEQQALEPRVHLLHEPVENLDALRHLAHARHGRLRILAAPLGLPDGLGRAIALGLEILGLGHQPAALGVCGEHRRERDLGAARRERALHRRRVFADQLDVEHRVPFCRPNHNKKKAAAARPPSPRRAPAAARSTLTAPRGRPARPPPGPGCPPGRPRRDR